MKKIKLIIFHPYSYVGGADNSLKRLIDQLDTRLFSITFISLNESFLKKHLNKKVEFIKIKSNRALFAISKLRKIVKKFYLSNNFSKVIATNNYRFQERHEIGLQASYRQKKTTSLQHFSRSETWCCQQPD